MSDVVRRLVEGYETELRLYGDLLALARDDGEGDAGARGVERTLARLREKGRILEEIARLDAGLAPLRERWDRERAARPHDEIAALNQVLERIAEVLEEALALEGRTARRFAIAQGLAGERSALVPASRAARYGDDDAGDACVSVRG